MEHILLLTGVSDGAGVGRVAVGGENFVCFNLFGIVLSVAGSACKFVIYSLKSVGNHTSLGFNSNGHKRAAKTMYSFLSGVYEILYIHVIN